MLCSTCVSMFRKQSSSSGYPSIRGHHHASLANLRAAVGEGCPLCSSIIQDYDSGDTDNAAANISKKEGDSRFLSFELRLMARTCPSGRLGTLSFESEDDLLASASYEIVYNDIVRAPKGYEEFLLKVKDDMMKEPWRVRNDGFSSSNDEFPTSTGHPEILKIGGDWLRRCLESHHTCENPEFFSDTAWVPKRLLDLSSPPSKVRLIITEHEKPQERYATLSHCWGPNPICVLTADNLEEWKKEIPISVLSQTFQESIAAARALNLRYLWIDSLCIVQAGAGSKEDWEEHAIAMRRVYTNSLVNIAAAKAECGADGLFATRTDLWLHPCHVQWPWPSQHHDLSPDAFWTIRKHEYHSQFAIRTLPLYTRGWVVQERFLASRVLHFGKDRIFWECKEEPMLDESYPPGFRSSCPEYDGVITWPFNLSSVSQNPSDGGKLAIPVNKVHWSSWQQMINEYTRCDLSFAEKDQFIALAGVAEKFGQAYGHQYVAGFFRQHLPFDLIWQSKDERSETYIAPSWSWASIDGQAHFPIGGCPYCNDCCESFVAVKDTIVELQTESFTYGPIKYAELTLSAYLLPCIIEPSIAAGTGLRQRAVLCSNTSPNGAPPEGKLSRSDKSLIWAEAYIDTEPDSLRGFADVQHFTAWAIPIMEIKPEAHEEVWKHHGLLLKKDQKGRFVRLGTYLVKEYVMCVILDRKNIKRIDVTII